MSQRFHQEEAAPTRRVPVGPSYLRPPRTGIAHLNPDQTVFHEVHDPHTDLPVSWCPHTKGIGHQLRQHY